MNVCSPLIVVATVLLSSCATAIGSQPANVEQISYFPQQEDVNYRSSMEAVIAGKLVNYNGCFAISNSNGISTILWHPRAKLNKDNRSVTDTQTGKVVTLNEVFELNGGTIDSEPLRSSLISAGVMHEQCITKK